MFNLSEAIKEVEANEKNKPKKNNDNIKPIGGYDMQSQIFL